MRVMRYLIILMGEDKCGRIMMIESWIFWSALEVAIKDIFNKMGNSLLAVRGINHKYIVVGGKNEVKKTRIL